MKDQRYNIIKKSKGLFLYILLLMVGILSSQAYAQNCSVNAGGNTIICGTTHTLNATSSGSSVGNPTWSILSKPSGAADPVFSNPNSLTTGVTGIDSPGNYVFQVSQPCGAGTATSTVTITAPGNVSAFTAGPDITNVNAATGTVTLNGVVPSGYTAKWSTYNIWKWERNSVKTDQNAQFSSTTSGVTTFSLIKKADHDIDPAYVVTLRITSINNPNCWYEDTAVVRFIPNPQLVPVLSTSKCIDSGGSHYIGLQNTSPRFNTGSPGAAGNPSYGTSVVMNITSQPAGGNISFWRIYDDYVYLNGITVTGTYKFTLQITNAAGTYTTPELSYTFNGISPGLVSFLVPSRPEQMMIYNSGGSGGEVHCGLAGQTSPLTFYYTINPADNPATVNTSVASSGSIPPGGTPIITNGGAGTATRSATITPPTGGWQIGTYRFTVTRSNAGVCGATQTYYIHISDGNRTDVKVDDFTVCYPGSGVVTATVPLPEIYKGVVNSSYFQDFDGRYRITLVSSPQGSAVPTFEPYNNILFTNSSTTISNLNMEGEYVFKIVADTYTNSVGKFLEAEYVCSGASMEDTFSIFVAEQVGANAGSVQNTTSSQIVLNGNDPGTASSGEWTLESKPLGAPDPVIVTPTLYNTNVTGLTFTGTYTFKWTIATGDCVSFDETSITYTAPGPGGVTEGLLMWHKADDGINTVPGATVQWNDVYGNRHVSQANAIRQPSLVTDAYYKADDKDYFFNFNPFYHFNGTSQFFERSGANGDYFADAIKAGSAYGVMYNSNATGYRTPYGWGDDDPNLVRNGEQYQLWRDNGTPLNSGNIGLTDMPVHIGSMIWKGTGTVNNGVYLNINGRIYTSTSANIGSINDALFRIGSEGAFTEGNEYFQGGISEVFAYGIDHQNNFTNNEKLRINSYLAVKYGISLRDEAGTGTPDYLTSGSVTVWDAMVNMGYNNNIFGIAKDDMSLLHQKQARSANANQKLIIGNGNMLYDTNAANTNNLTNEQFLLVGDNGLKQSLAVPLNYNGTNGDTNFRFESVWKVQNTQNVGALTIAWPKGVRNLYLIQSPDTIFDATDAFTPMVAEITINGVVYNTANVTLANGQYFTFGGYGIAPGGVFDNLNYWYRADIDAEHTGEGTDVTGWTDQWSQTTVKEVGGNNLPKYKEGTVDYFNFNPGINFTSINETIGTRSVQTIFNANNDLFMVTKEGMTYPGSPNPHFFSIGMDNVTTTINNWDYLGLWPNGPVERRVYNGGTNFPNVLPGYSTTIPSIMYYNFLNQPYSRGLNGAANGTVYNSPGAMGIPLGGHIFGSTRWTGSGSDNGGFIGHIGETIIYGSGNITPIERRKVDSYLAIKYGVTLGRVETEHYLDANENIVWDGSANADYNNNIFGVAREDIGLFEQKVSKSVNPNTLLTVATVNDFISPNLNIARTGFTHDKTYFLLGDNNITGTITNTIEIDGKKYKKIQRTWLSQRHNTAGNVYFQTDLSDYGVDFGLLNNVVMLIADNEDFTINVRTVSGIHQVGKWLYNYNFDAETANQYISYGVPEKQCLPEFVWSSPVTVSGSTATGTIDGIEYTYASNKTVNTSAQIFDGYSVFPVSTGSADIFSFPRTAHSVIRNIDVTSNTITFNQPVTDPILVFSSLGNAGVSPVPVTFGQPIELLWSGAAGGNGFVTWDSPTQITGREGYAIVRIPGTHTSVSFEYTAAENYANFLFGISKERDCDKVPLIITNPMLINRARQ